MSAAAFIERFSGQDYVVVRGLLPSARVKAVRDHLERRAAQGSLRMEGDAQVPGTPSAHGDAILDGLMEELRYRGIDLTHWREPYAGQSLVQVFLHYVDQDGPHKGEKFDRRAALGDPLVLQ
jgi:hypothetical protein